MKLKPTFLLQEVDDTFLLVSADIKNFNGFLQLNRTAAFIVECLKQETTREAVLAALCEKYDAPRDMISSDLEEVLAMLRRARALEE